MKHFRWPRPPLVLGFILGSVLERYMFISIERYGIDWIWRPVVIVMVALSVLSLMRPLLQDIRAHHGLKAMLTEFGAPRLTADNLFPVALLALFAAMMAESFSWPFAARIVPTIVGFGAILFCALSLADDVFSKRHREGPAAEARGAVQQKIHMDIASRTTHLPGTTILARGAMFFGWLVAFLCCMALIGLIPTVPIFVIGYMRLEGPEKWRHAALMALVMMTLIYVVFDQLLSIPWPPTLLGTLVPVLKIIPSV